MAAFEELQIGNLKSALLMEINSYPINLVVSNELCRSDLLLRQELGDRGSKSGLSVIYMSNCTNIQMRLGARKLSFSIESPSC